MENSSKDTFGDNSSKDTLTDSTKEEMRHSGEGDNTKDQSTKVESNEKKPGLIKRFFYNPYTVRILGGLFLAGLIFICGVYKSEILSYIGISFEQEVIKK